MADDVSRDRLQQRIQKRKELEAAASQTIADLNNLTKSFDLQFLSPNKRKSNSNENNNDSISSPVKNVLYYIILLLFLKPAFCF
jgi:hypothetical protein